MKDREANIIDRLLHVDEPEVRAKFLYQFLALTRLVGQEHSYRFAGIVAELYVAETTAHSTNEITKALESLSISSSQQARKLMFATWVLAFATVGLAVATCAHVYVALAGPR